mmetsp:Transcript_10860/g.9583  ORF Transcript_10860/g.9583 Transcript_10860/m.9583 type:complete len:97 (+) Transcript_10860:20-310(+)
MDGNKDNIFLPIPEKNSSPPELSLNLQAKRKKQEEKYREDSLSTLPTLMSVVSAPSPIPPRSSSQGKGSPIMSERTLPNSRKERNRMFAKESRDRK